MRITKEPEERKQEILETAIRLFCEKGYERTSIADIAKKMGVAQGLCYRYFPSKEALFDSAVDQYAQLLASQYPSAAEEKPLRQILEDMPVTVETDQSDNYRLFHNGENKKFHDQLALKVCETLLPQATRLLEAAQKRGEVQLDDLEAAAAFCVYGQLGILLHGDESSEEKGKRIRDFLIYALRL